jgi:hypothetical protein
MEDDKQAKIEKLVDELRMVTDAKFVLLVDHTGHEVASSGNPDVQVDWAELDRVAGGIDLSVRGRLGLGGGLAHWSPDQQNPRDHADVAVLDGRWSLAVVFKSQEELESDRTYIAPIVDALRDSLAATTQRRESTPSPGAPPERGGGSSPPAELGIPIWWIRDHPPR